MDQAHATSAKPYPLQPECLETGDWIAQRLRVESNVTGKRKIKEMIPNDTLLYL